jgi:hypothetical protein
METSTSLGLSTSAPISEWTGPVAALRPMASQLERMEAEERDFERWAGLAEAVAGEIPELLDQTPRALEF